MTGSTPDRQISNSVLPDAYAICQMKHSTIHPPPSRTEIVGAGTQRGDRPQTHVHVHTHHRRIFIRKCHLLKPCVIGHGDSLGRRDARFGSSQGGERLARHSCNAAPVAINANISVCEMRHGMQKRLLLGAMLVACASFVIFVSLSALSRRASFATYGTATRPSNPTLLFTLLDGSPDAGWRLRELVGVQVLLRSGNHA